MCVTGYCVGDGMTNWFLKDFQYRCSAVMGAGPEGSFSCGSGATSAAIATTTITGKLLSYVVVL